MGKAFEQFRSSNQLAKKTCISQACSKKEAYRLNPLVPDVH